MKRLIMAAAALTAVAATAGCSQIAQLKPVAGDAVTGVRIATNDVLLDAGVAIQVAPVCTFTETDYTCKGTTTDGQPILAQASQVATDAVPPDLTLAAEESEEGADDVVVLEVTVGDQQIFRGLVSEVLRQNARADQ